MSRAFDIGLAAFAAGAIAFAVFSMPGALLVRLAGGGTLAILGSLARPGLAFAAAVAVFLAVWLGLRALGRAPVRRAPEQGEADDEWAAPRLRRADAHPDAPAPRPLLAGKDLGEPAEDAPAIETGVALEAPEEISAEQAEAAPLARILMRKSVRPSDTTDARADAVDEPAGPEESVEDSVGAGEAAAPVTEQPIEATDLPGAKPQGDLDGEEAFRPKSLLERLSPPEGEEAGVARLLRRLDDGFGGCEWPLPAGADSGKADARDDRLRGVLDDLQRVASRSA